MSNDPTEITRVIAIEHAGEKLAIEVHVHLSKAELEHLAERVEQIIAEKLRMANLYYPTSLMLIEHRGRVKPEIKLEQGGEL